VQATLDAASCEFLSQWPSAPDPGRSAAATRLPPVLAIACKRLRFPGRGHHAGTSLGNTAKLHPPNQPVEQTGGSGFRELLLS